MNLIIISSMMYIIMYIIKTGDVYDEGAKEDGDDDVNNDDNNKSNIGN